MELNQFSDRLARVMEVKGVAAGNITQDVLLKTIIIVFADFNAQNNPSNSSSEERDTRLEPLFWGGKMHVLPKDFRFPSIDVLVAWKLWWFRNKTLRHPAFRTIPTVDLSTKAKKNTYSEWPKMIDFIMKGVVKATKKSFLSSNQRARSCRFV